MKKMIAALVLATSFAAFADDAAKTAPPAKAEKKTTEKKTTETKSETGEAGDREGSREEVSRFADLLHVGGVGQARARLTPLARSVL